MKFKNVPITFSRDLLSKNLKNDVNTLNEYENLALGKLLLLPQAFG